MKPLRCVHTLVLLAALIIAVGCATTYTTRSTGFTAFLAFEGTQSSWPQAANALVKADFAVPAYLGLPSRTYRVIGFVVSDEPLASDQKLPAWLWGDETRLANACNQARNHGADAVLLSKDPALVGLMRPQAGRDPQSYRLLTNFDGVIVAIQWADRR